MSSGDDGNTALSYRERIVRAGDNMQQIRRGALPGAVGTDGRRTEILKTIGFGAGAALQRPGRGAGVGASAGEGAGAGRARAWEWAGRREGARAESGRVLLADHGPGYGL